MAMENRLHEAAIEGNVAILLELLQQDPLILDMAILSSYHSPLHIAALLGHSDFAIKLLQLKPQLAYDLDSRGFSPLHLAAAKGHFDIVRDLLRIDSQLCLVCDGNGRNPLHLAAINGRFQTLEELIKSRPEAARTAVDHGGTVLHLCVKYNQLESLKLLIKAIDDTIFLNAKDDYGFTILHLAVSNKQLETVELLVKTNGMEVNAVNSNGLTPLDLLVQSNRDINDLDIAESLRAFGAQRTTTPFASENTNQNPSATRPAVSCDGGSKHWLSSERDALMVVASVIATMAFQAATNPPGGAWQEDNQNSNPNQVAGKSIMGTKNPDHFATFIAFMTAGFAFSAIDLFLLIIGFPSRIRSSMRIVVYYMVGGAISSIGIGYWYSVQYLIPDSAMSRVGPMLLSQLLVYCVLLIVVLLISSRKSFISRLRRFC